MFSSNAFTWQNLVDRLRAAQEYRASLTPGIHDREQIEAADADVILAQAELDEFVPPEPID